jgi:hypothetical protein
LEATTVQITDRCFEECIEQQMAPEQCKSFILEQIQSHELIGLEVEIVRLRNVTAAHDHTEQHNSSSSTALDNLITIPTNVNGQVACDVANGWVAFRFDWLRKSHPDDEQAVRIAADCGGDNVDACCEGLHKFAGRNTDDQCLYCAPKQQVLTPVVYPGTDVAGGLGFKDNVFNMTTGECDVIYYTKAEVEDIDRQTRHELFALEQYWGGVVIEQGSISCQDLQLFQNNMLFYARAVFPAHPYLGALTCQFCEDGEFVGSWEVLLSSIAEAFFLIERMGIDSAVAKVTIYVSVDGTTVISTPVITGRYEVDCDEDPLSPDDDVYGEEPPTDGDDELSTKTCALPGAASTTLDAMDVSTMRETCIRAAEEQGLSNVPRSNTCNMVDPPRPPRGVGKVITLVNGPVYDSATCTTTLEYIIKSFTGAHHPRRALWEQYILEEQGNQVVDAVVAHPQEDYAAAVDDSFFGRVLRVFTPRGGGGISGMAVGRGGGGGLPRSSGFGGRSSPTPTPPTAGDMGHAVIGWMGSCVLDSFTITQGSSVVVLDTETANDDVMFLQDEIETDTCMAGLRVAGDIIPKRSSVTIRMVFDGFTGMTDAAASAESAILKWGNHNHALCVPIKLSVADCRPGAGPSGTDAAAAAAADEAPSPAPEEGTRDGIRGRAGGVGISGRFKGKRKGT